MKADIIGQVDRRSSYKLNFNQKEWARHSSSGQNVLAKDLRTNRAKKWAPGKLVDKIGWVMWTVMVEGILCDAM